MCGICGAYGYGGVTPDLSLLLRMNATLRHRGPDDEGHWSHGPVALAMRRLAIIDVTGGHQPIANEDQRIQLVFNGEIYNFQELRETLCKAGHRFATRSDTEVIVHAYEEWGDDCVLRFNGIFAFSLWDARKQRLLLARDHFGVKPLYYRDDGRRVLWASEIKALLIDPSVPRDVDLEALHLFLQFRFVPSPYTLFAGVRKLPPGHRLVADATGTRLERYWHPVPETMTDIDEESAVAEMQQRLERAVSGQMISDVPVGALLSGGIDSAVIVALMSRATGHQVRTFSIGFSEGGTANELDDARETARLLGTEHHDICVERTDYVEMLERAVWHLDEPISTTSALAVFLVCELARKHVTVVLTGQGADEPLAGYHRYYGERYGAYYRMLPRVVREGLVRPIVETLPRQERLKRAVRSLGNDNTNERFGEVYAVFHPAMRNDLWLHGMSPAGADESIARVIEYWRRGVEHLDPLLQMTYIDARLSLSDDLLTNGDKMSMAASVEARVPFLDLEYMDFVERLPARMRIRGTTRKYLHKKAVAKWLPAEIIARPKRGFETPIDQWFRKELGTYVQQTLLAPDSASRRYFCPTVIEALIADHRRGHQDNRRQLFSLLVFELWHRTFIDRPVAV